MATLYVTEYANLGVSPGGGSAPVVAEPPIAEQTVAIGGSSAASSAFANNTNFIRLHTDAICSVIFGTAPTATAAKRRMAANQTEYVQVPVNKLYKVAVITNS